ncbi:FecR domain-containing protein [Janthinobacterium sp.]|uniref:FecR family protein n=1 Tax=Janthinobacterium sp. TaxID=1871054 RepID=UPI00262F65A9|nr:FecR domain-containing protein [Janthinobacterium sp.]
MQQPPSEHDFGPSAQDEADLRTHGADATQDPVTMAAATWFSRRHQLDAGGQADFETWLAQDAAHGRAYAAMQDTHRQVRQIPPGIAARWTVAPAAAAAPAVQPRRHWLRAWPYAAAAMLALSVGVGGYEWSQQQASFTQSYATQRGQRLAVSLPDGSSLMLDTSTRLNVRLYPRRREVQLLQGEAMFQVQAKQGLPFDVFSGPLKVTVVGTQFSVRNTLPYDGKLSVAVQQGHVRVTGNDHSQVDLLAGQGLQADAAGQLSSISHLPPDSVAPWRKGRVTVDNLPLGQLLAEFERYGDTGLVVRDPAVARLRIGGSFSLTQLDGFAAALPQLLPVQIVRSKGLSEIRLAPRLQDQRPSAQLAAPLPAPR